eukprot:390129-Pleurochrysis_carterae.AAC.1
MPAREGAHAKPWLAPLHQPALAFRRASHRHRAIFTTHRRCRRFIAALLPPSANADLGANAPPPL